MGQQDIARPNCVVSFSFFRPGSQTWILSPFAVSHGADGTRGSMFGGRNAKSSSVLCQGNGIRGLAITPGGPDDEPSGGRK